ncbi:protein mono-ADP-ribosyltransferase PARP14-like isoform 2-T2 [Aulostomus maculatus]
MDGAPGPVTVEGDWSPAESRTIKNKLQIYFQSRKKSSGGDCRVEVEDGAARAAVYFRSDEVRDRVLAKENHEILLGDRTLRLWMVSAPNSANGGDGSDPATDPKPGTPSGDDPGDQAADTEVVSVAVVLNNVSKELPRDLLSMLVESVSGLDEGDYSLEVIWDTCTAVVTFSSVADAENFLAVSQKSQRLQKHGLTTRRLEAAKSIRVECLPLSVVRDILELYFEKNWTLPDDVSMIPAEQAAIVTFSDHKVVQKICIKQQYMMCSVPVKIYPYYESLGSALYGKERPVWKMPEPFVDNVHHAVRKFLLTKKLSETVNQQMLPYFCCVELGDSEVTLRPLPALMRRTGLTAKHVADWMSDAQKAFHQQMAQYTAFECPANAPAWKASEAEIRLNVGDNAVLLLDTSRGILTVAGHTDRIRELRVPVENILRKSMIQIERQSKSVSEEFSLSTAMFYILKEDGLQEAAVQISPEMKLSYNEDAQTLTISGFPAEVYQTKSWILERKAQIRRKALNVPPHLLDFLKTVNPTDMSNELFTSKGISAIYSIESQGIFLLANSDNILAAAETRMQAVLRHQTLDVEDQEVLKLPSWLDLIQNLLASYNSLKKKTVGIQIHPERKDKVTVVGFVDPVEDVSRSLKKFIVNYSHVRETMLVESCAVVQFINKKRDWSDIVKNNNVTVHFDSGRPRILIAGARLHVQKARACFQELSSALCTENYVVDKPGAKKYFLSQGSLILPSLLTDFNCMVLLRPDTQEEESFTKLDGLCYCKVQTSSGVQVSVSKADICSFGVDAVVNAANEELKHIGGLALALLTAAGPQLQKLCNDYIISNGALQPGDAIITDACKLPCKYVVHAVGPRFSDSDENTSVSRLKKAVKESLRQAEKVNSSTVALPAISSGMFGFPVGLCADTIAQAVREYCDRPGGVTSLTEIHLVDNNDNTVRVLATAMNKEFTDLRPTMTIPQQAGGGGALRRQHSPGEDKSQAPRGHQVVERGGASGGPSRGRHSKHGRTAKLEQTTAEGLKILLCEGNIQDQTTDAIVNTIAETMNLNQGAISKAILQAAGSRLQPALLSKAGATTLQYGDVIVTDGFDLRCQKVFHAVCPLWDNGAGQAKEELISIVRFCLEEAEKCQMTSLAFPAVGTGNLSFPRDVVSQLLLREMRRYSRQRNPRHLREVAVVVHPSDNQTVECFTREFRGHSGPGTAPPEEASQSRQLSAAFGQVSSPSLGVYRMQMGQLSLEVSSGDITKEGSDVIINSSNKDFTLRTGVSQAILGGAGQQVVLECSQIVNSQGSKLRPMILTSAGQLPCRNILHVVGHSDPASIKNIVYSVLKVCEENKFSSVSFPALGTGRGGANPSAVADAMINAVVEFVRKKHQRSVKSVKILIFQAAMVTAFHKSMRQQEGKDMQDKSVFTKFRESFTSFFMGSAEERPGPNSLVLKREEFEPTVFQLCADNAKAVSQAKKRIEELIVGEQAEKTIVDRYISHLSQADVEKLQALQRKLTVSIRLDQRQEDQEPCIHLEGLTRDVLLADSTVREVLREVERSENLRSKALLLSGLVEWKFQQPGGSVVTFDMFTNLALEEALERKHSVKITINSETFNADVQRRKATSASGRKEVELYRKDLKDAGLPAHWDDMNGDLVKLFQLVPGSSEYKDVEKEFFKTGLTANIIQIERIQNETLWQNYQLMKKQLEAKNQHKNNEKILFHGTGSSSIDLINKQGFNRSYAGAHGAMFGNGSYFAVDPAYSAGGYSKPDPSGKKRMYLARVLVGDFTVGKAGIITPPSKDPLNAADLYDSVTDRTTNPTIFVTFSDIQAYPEYLITFS